MSNMSDLYFSSVQRAHIHHHSMMAQKLKNSCPTLSATTGIIFSGAVVVVVATYIDIFHDWYRFQANETHGFAFELYEQILCFSSWLKGFLDRVLFFLLIFLFFYFKWSAGLTEWGCGPHATRQLPIPGRYCPLFDPVTLLTATVIDSLYRPLPYPVTPATKRQPKLSSSWPIVTPLTATVIDSLYCPLHNPL